MIELKGNVFSENDCKWVVSHFSFETAQRILFMAHDKGELSDELYIKYSEDI